MNYTEVESSHQNACALQEEHSHFTQNSMVSQTLLRTPIPPLLKLEYVESLTASNDLNYMFFSCWSSNLLLDDLRNL